MTAAAMSPVVAGLIDQIAAAADDVDAGARSVRGHIAALADAGVVELGAPVNHDGELPAMARLIDQLAGACMSTAFSLWAQRMTIEYLRLADTPWAREAADTLAGGASLGVTGMASAFKEAAGCGSLDLDAAPDGDGWVVNGTLRWASNLQPDSIMVSCARADDGRRLMIGVPLGAPGVAIGAPFDLLALGSTHSSSVTLSDVRVPAAQVLTEDFEGFIGAVRPTFLLLQSAMCLGLAGRCLSQARSSVDGINASLAADVDALTSRWSGSRTRLGDLAASVGSSAIDRRVLLEFRLNAAELAVGGAGLEIRTAGGRGYTLRTDVNRRFREATFLPVQSPSETQLRWELSHLSG